MDSLQQFYSDSNYNHVLVRYAKQIDAEKAIIAIDRSFFFSSWCRGKFRIFEICFQIIFQNFANFGGVSKKNSKLK